MSSWLFNIPKDDVMREVKVRVMEREGESKNEWFRSGMGGELVTARR